MKTQYQKNKMNFIAFNECFCKILRVIKIKKILLGGSILFLFSMMGPYSYSETKFDGELQDCQENLEKSKKETTLRTQMSQFFCKGSTIAAPKEDWKCEPYSPRPILCEKAYFRCRRTYECRKETSDFNRSLLFQQMNQL